MCNPGTRQAPAAPCKQGACAAMISQAAHLPAVAQLSYGQAGAGVNCRLKTNTSPRQHFDHHDGHRMDLHAGTQQPTTWPLRMMRVCGVPPMAAAA